MKKVMSRVLAVVICLAMVMESQTVNVFADEQDNQRVIIDENVLYEDSELTDTKDELVVFDDSASLTSDDEDESALLADTVDNDIEFSEIINDEIQMYKSQIDEKIEADGVSRDDYYDTYGLSYEDLFMLCPEYLNRGYFNNLESRLIDATLSAENEVSKTETVLAGFFSSLKDGTYYIANALASGLGLSGDEYHNFKDEMILELLEEYSSISDYKGWIDELSKQWSGTKTYLDLTSDAVREGFVQQIASQSTLSEKDAKKLVEKLTDDTYGPAAEILSAVGTSMEVASIICGVTMMYELEVGTLQDLMNVEGEAGETELYEELSRLLYDRTTDPVTYIISTYGTKKVIKKLSGKLTSKAFTSFSFMATALGSFACDLVADVYEQANPSVSDIVYTAILHNYWNTSERTCQNIIYKFRTKSATKEDIRRFEAAYNFKLSCMKLWMEKAKGCTRNANTKRILDWNSVIGSTISYENYIELCIRDASEDIKSGKLVINSSQVIRKTDDGTVIDDSYDSTESIAARFQAIQNQYRPGQTWTGSWGGCIQCFGFARMVFSMLFDCEMPYAYYGNRPYELANNGNVIEIGQVSGAGVTSDSVKALLSQGKLGDIIQASGSTYGQHTMVFVGASDNAVKVYDCNSAINGQPFGSCYINEWDISYDSMANWYGSGDVCGITLYRACNYAEIYGDGDYLFFDDSVNFQIVNGILQKYTGSQKYVSIPDTVTGIGEKAFYNNAAIQYVYIPDTVISIGKSAFENCSSLLAIDIPDSVTSIGEYAFRGCINLCNARLSQNQDYTSIENGLFANCIRLKTINIPKSWIKNKNIFWYGSGNAPFFNCASLNSIVFESGTTEIPESLFQDCTGLRKIEIPLDVTKIGQSAFYKATNLEEIALPEKLTTIERNAFMNCEALKSITIPDSVETIGEFAFSECKSLTSVYLSSQLTTINAGLFMNCISLHDINIPLSCCRNTGFSNAGEGKGPFKGCPGDVIFKFDRNMKELPNIIFQDYDELKSFTIPNGVNVVNQGVFLNCKGLEEILFPNSLEKIDAYAFKGCSALVDVDIPDSVSSIGKYAFTNCTSLKQIHLPKNLSKIEGGLLTNCSMLEKVNIPKACCRNTAVADYGTGAGPFEGCSESLIIDFEKGVTQIPDSIFQNYKNLKIIVIPDTVTVLNQGVFRGATSLEEVVLPNTLKTIGSKCFDNCTKLESIDIPKSTTVIAKNAFSKKMTIYGIFGSYAETYATENNHTFIGKDEIPLTSLSLSQNSIEIGTGETILLNVLFEPKNTTDDTTIKWETDNSSVATVDNGLITGKSEGNAVIKATIGSLSAECTVTVVRKMTSLSASPDNMVLYVGQEESIYVCSNIGLIPEDKLKIENSNPSTVSYTAYPHNGLIKIKGLNVGNSKLKIKADLLETHVSIKVLSSSIKFKDQDGTNLGIAPIDAIYGEKYPNLPTPVKSGNTFIGWYTGPNGTGSLITDKSIFNGIDVLYAAWTKDDGKFRILTSKDFSYAGKAILPVLTVYDGVNLLIPNKDYKVSFKNNKNAYEISEGNDGFNAKKAPSITITGLGNYSSKDVIFFRILPLNISEEDFEADNLTLAYTKKNQKISPTLYWKGSSLKNGKDYKFAIYKADDIGRANSIGASVKDVGDYIIRFTGINNFTGTREVNLKVNADYIPVGNLSVGKIKDIKYTGREITPEPIIKDGKKLLVKNTHYTLSYTTNTEVGTGFVFVTGKPENGYSGTRRVAFKITGTPVKNAIISGLPKAVSYTGNEIKYGTDALKLYIKASKKTPQIDLVRDKDYSLSYSNNTNVGKATIVLKGKGSYTGTVTKTLKINPFDISSNADTEGRFVINCAATAVYSKGGAKPKISASFKNADGSVQELVAGKDYTVSYKNNTSVGGTKKPIAIVSGKGNFKGKRNCEFSITTKDISLVKLNASDTVFKNKANTYSTKISLVDTDGKALKSGTDYEKKLKYSYLNDTEVKVNGAAETRAAGVEVGTKDVIPAGTTIKVTATGKGNYTNTVSGTYRIANASISSAKVSEIATQIYSGKPITLDPVTFTVKVGKTKLIPYNEVTGEGDFIIEGYSNNTKKGTATATLQGVGDYGGTKTVKFKINAKGFK